MRVVQLIDTLDLGGAEKMALNYANLLAEKIAFSGLVATRKEGELNKNIGEKVNYLFLSKKRKFDLKALSALKAFVAKNKIDLVHAHGTSFFLATLLKFIYPKIKIVYHEHFGGRATQSWRKNPALIFCSLFFSEIVVVNFQLKNWCSKKLFCKKITFLPNFLIFQNTELSETNLSGTQGKRIVFLANLKHPKNQLFFLEAFYDSQQFLDGWTVHLIGKIFENQYSQTLTNFIKDKNLSNVVFLYDVCNDVTNILKQATIGVLASTDEGFPVTILEYAHANLPVIVPNVGYCSQMVDDQCSGFVFDISDKITLVQKISLLCKNQQLRLKFGHNLHEFCDTNYQKNKVIDDLLVIYSRQKNE